MVTEQSFHQDHWILFENIAALVEMPHYSSIVTDVTSCRPTATLSCDQLPCSSLAPPIFSDSHYPIPCYTSSSQNINLFLIFFYIFFISCIEPAVNIFVTVTVLYLLLFCICSLTWHPQCRMFLQNLRQQCFHEAYFTNAL